MADICENELTIWGDKKELKRFRKVADERKLPLSERDPFRGANEPTVLSFHRLIPIPPEVVALGYDPPQGGYDWEKEHWGVKWGACHAKRDKFRFNTGAVGLYYTFDTAWFPATDFFKKVSQDFPDLTFRLDFRAESGWRGEEHYKAGEERDEYE